MDQRRSEITEPRRMLQLLLDTIPTRVFWKDIDSIYLGCNRLFAADAGYSSEDDIRGEERLRYALERSGPTGTGPTTAQS